MSERSIDHLSKATNWHYCRFGCIAVVSLRLQVCRRLLALFRSSSSLADKLSAVGVIHKLHENKKEWLVVWAIDFVRKG